jgi:hypothetical protein
MTGVELKAILDTYSHPIRADRNGGVFDLYERVTGVKKLKRCGTCLEQCLFELRCLVRKYEQNEIPLEKPIISIEMVQTNKALIKYRIKQPFRVHGIPKIQTNENTTDEEVETLLKMNPKLRGHFERTDGKPVMEFAEPVAIVRTSQPEVETHEPTKVESKQPVTKTRKKRGK